MKGTRIVAMLALAVTGLMSAAFAGDTGTPVVAVCLGTGGNDVNGTWSMRQSDAVPGVVSNCVNTVSDPGDPTACDPGIPPLDPFQILLDTLDCPVEALPLGNSQNLKLSAVGDFACGSGTLTSTGLPDNQFGWLDGTQGQVRWQMDWTASFSDGVGQISGTALNPDTGDTRNLGGTMVIEDGAATGTCDDSAGAQHVIARLVVS